MAALATRRQELQEQVYYTHKAKAEEPVRHSCIKRCEILETSPSKRKEQKLQERKKQLSVPHCGKNKRTQTAFIKSMPTITEHLSRFINPPVGLAGILCRREILTYVPQMQAGTMFLKSCRRGNPHPTLVKLSQDMKTLEWTSKYGSQRSFSLSQVKNLELLRPSEQPTSNYLFHSYMDTMLSHCAGLSNSGMDPITIQITCKKISKRSGLSLTTSSFADYKLWVGGLEHVVQRVNYMIELSSSKEPSLQSSEKTVARGNLFNFARAKSGQDENCNTANSGDKITEKSKKKRSAPNDENNQHLANVMAAEPPLQRSKSVVLVPESCNKLGAQSPRPRSPSITPAELRELHRKAVGRQAEAGVLQRRNSAGQAPKIPPKRNSKTFPKKMPLRIVDDDFKDVDIDLGDSEELLEAC